jgi:uncharacterized protein (DUF2141 family)
MNGNKNLFIILLLNFISLIGATSSSFGQQALEIKVANIKKNTGKIIVEIYDSKSSRLKTP